MIRNLIKPCILAFALLFSAAGATEEEKTGPQFAYYTLQPDLTTNFHTSGKKLGYLQVRIDIMVADATFVPLLEQHTPLIRDAVIDLLGKQGEDKVKSLSGREDLRKELMAHLNEILLPETGKTVVSDLLFTKYLYQ
ncbi:flagellar basal body-associated protein FliL [Vibrio penaeicida]|uniref:Flagellar protein FliL n=1 Tax=Vibrio penaeicida TaxID=104609 RepID=A0AAV5NVT4_9VIBR|nr:flagellar basal body-associated protein FliL [Vibrio penaeicida]RTZ23565.1 flagellar basal body-associated protein FliL [Vibrio penaeicida]GLQ74653.1 flagellar basal body-associated protein FliL [Vibrio penaeicida]